MHNFEFSDKISFVTALKNGLHHLAHLSFHNENNARIFAAKRMEYNGAFDSIRNDMMKQQSNFYFINQELWKDIDNNAGEKYWLNRNNLPNGSYCIFSNNDLASLFRIKNEDGIGTMLQFSFYQNKLTSCGLMSWLHKDIKSNLVTIDARTLDDSSNDAKYSLHFPFQLGIDLVSAARERQAAICLPNSNTDFKTPFGIKNFVNQTQVPVKLVE